MPKSHDAKPRNRIRRLKAASNSIIPAFANQKSERQNARMRSRELTEAAFQTQREVAAWLERNGVRGRAYERAVDQAQAERQPLAQIMMELAGNPTTKKWTPRSIITGDMTA